MIIILHLYNHIFSIIQVINIIGEMAEWFMAPAWKACSRVIVSGVRIPVSPPDFLKRTFLMSFCASVSATRNPSISELSRFLV